MKKYTGEKYVGEQSVGEKSVGEEAAGEKSLGEKFGGGVKNLCVKSLWAKSQWVNHPWGKNRGRWDAGLRSPLSGFHFWPWEEDAPSSIGVDHGEPTIAAAAFQFCDGLALQVFEMEMFEQWVNCVEVTAISVSSTRTVLESHSPNQEVTASEQEFEDSI